MSLLVIFYVLALRVVDNFSSDEARPRARTLPDLPVTRSDAAGKIVGGSSGRRPEVIAFAVTEAGAT
jgi:hypothetical protein